MSRTSPQLFRVPRDIRVSLAALWQEPVEEGGNRTMDRGCSVEAKHWGYAAAGHHHHHTATTTSIITSYDEDDIVTDKNQQ